MAFFSYKSFSKLKSNDSFGICTSWGFRNTPWLLNLMKNWLRYWGFTTSHVMFKFSSSKIRSKSRNMGFVKPSISWPILHQIQQSGSVSESSGLADSKTVIGFQIWPRLVGEKDQNISQQMKWLGLYVEVWIMWN